tara:strand:- start:2114 stop:4204 length:2091 start_codon:yes stop_codon:yes gene_type:complete
MFISIIINASFIYILFALIISILLSFFLYKRQTNLLDVPKYWIISLGILRFFSFFLLFILLLKPEVKTHEKIIEKPLIVFIQDNTTSIISNYDSLYYKNEYLKKIDSLKNISSLNIDWITFDKSIKQKIIDFSGKSTNISAALREVINMYSNTYVSAYILASDGIFNEGLNPIYLDLYFNAPLYTLNLGDTIQYRDAKIKSVKHNKITYLGNQTPIEIVVEAQGMIDQALSVEVFQQENKSSPPQSIQKQIFDVDNNNYVNSFQFFIEPEKPGLHNYYVYLDSKNIEKNTLNNKKDFFIDVIDDRKKILILFNSHHPDIAAIKESLEFHDEYEVYTHWISDLNLKEVIDQPYSLIIAHQLSDEAVFHQLNNYESTPIWYILGHNSNLSAFNESQDFVQFNNNETSFEYANVALNQNFSSFLISDSLSEFLSLSTPFLTPFSNFSVNSLSEALLYKQIGSLNTERPVLFFVESDCKHGFLLGEGLWRWRLNDTYLNNSNSLFNHFLSQIVQYLLLNEDKSRLHVSFDNIHASDDPIHFEVELYNKNFELITSPEIDITLIDSIGDSYDYKFIPIDNKYYLDIRLPDGSYDFTVKTEFNNEKLTKKGQLIVSDFDIEARDLVSNHSLLSDLAFNHNGSMMPKDSLRHLINNITSNSDFKPKAYFNYYFQLLINFELVLILILFSLFLEWLIRRRYINY